MKRTLFTVCLVTVGCALSENLRDAAELGSDLPFLSHSCSYDRLRSCSQSCSYDSLQSFSQGDIESDLEPDIKFDLELDTKLDLELDLKLDIEPDLELDTKLDIEPSAPVFELTRLTSGQRLLMVENATDLYADVMKCTAFCLREFVRGVVIGASNELLRVIESAKFEKRILQSFQKKLVEIESKLSNLDDLSLDNEIPQITTSDNLERQLTELYRRTPVPMRRVLHFQIDLIRSLGIRDQSEYLVIELLSDLITGEDTKVYRFLAYSCIDVVNECTRKFYKQFITNFGIKLEETNCMPFTPFDVRNLLAHGQDRLDWAKVLVFFFSQAKSIRVKNEKHPDEPLKEAIDQAMVDLMRKCACFVRQTPSEFIFTTYLNEKNLNEENFLIFKNCRDKIRNICSRIINYTLDYHESVGTPLTMAVSSQFGSFTNPMEFFWDYGFTY